ncbi:MAG: glycosyltransferase family 9 protein [Phycisphaeraceae bacterium]|nr:glycosyltransferase family 9 protein [Phycisphaeraceae bacterium]
MSSSSPRILLVRPSALGDVARTVPALVTLRQAFPAARIDWLVHDQYADVISHHPALTGVLPFPRRIFKQGFFSRASWAAAWQLRRALVEPGYDMVFDLQGLARSGLFTWLTGARRRVGFANAREGAHRAYNRRHHINRSIHTVDRMLNLLAAEGFTPSHDMSLYVSPADNQWLDEYLAEHGGTDQPYVALAPTARWLCKCWPIERYAYLASQLLKAGRVGQRMFVLVAPAERAYVQPLLNALGSAALFPATTVGQLMAVISRAQLVVCNDSAPLHIAVGFKRPLATIFGPTDPALVGPYQRPETVARPPGLPPMTGREYRKMRNDQSLIAQVTIDQVWQIIEEQLARPVYASRPQPLTPTP